MLNKTVWIASLSVCLIRPAIAADQPLGQVLSEQYQGKVLALRHSFKLGTQEYAADGTLVTSGEEGPWTLYGRILVNKVTVDERRLKIEGKRSLCFFDSNGNLVQFKNDRKHPAEDLKVSVRLEQPLVSAEAAREVLGRVFAFTPEDMVNAVPDSWRRLMAKQLGVELPKKPDSEHTGEGDEGKGTVTPNEARTAFDPKELLPPSILSQPFPSYTNEARSGHIQGVVGLNIVIDPSGQVRGVTLIHPLGMGLDENAIDTVKKWKFIPAKRDGRPVAVSVFVEVAFHLY